MNTNCFQVDLLENRTLLTGSALNDVKFDHTYDLGFNKTVHAYDFTLNQPAMIAVSPASVSVNAVLSSGGKEVASGSGFQAIIPVGHYSFRAFTGVLSGASFKLRLTHTDAPTRLDADVWGSGAVHLNWDDNSDHESYYRIQRWTHLGWRRSVRVSADATAAVVDGLKPSTGVTYRVSSIDADGTSSLSNIVHATTSSQNTDGFYKVNLGSGNQGEAGWTLAKDTMVIYPTVRDNKSKTDSIWIHASSWQSAVWQTIGSWSDNYGMFDPVSIKTDQTDGNGSPTYEKHQFPTGGDFKVATGQELHSDSTVSDNDLSNDGTKYIALEDSYGSIDHDFDDFYWKITTKFATLSETKTASDQFAGKDDNYISDTNTYTGGVKDFILMGTRQDNDAYARLDLNLAGSDKQDFQNGLVFAWKDLEPTVDSSKNDIITSTSSGGTYSIHGDVPETAQQFISSHVVLVAGFDYDGDGKLEDSELVFTDTHQFRVVTQDQYNGAIDTLKGIVNGSLNAYPVSSNFLYAFYQDQGLAGAVNTPTTINSSNPKLDHHVGLQFGTPNNARLATFNPSGSSSLPQLIADSPEVRSYIEKTISVHAADLKAQAPPGDYELDTGYYDLLDDQGHAASGQNFVNGDLHFSLGHVDLAGRIMFTIKTQLDSNGNKVLYVLHATLKLNVDDITDFQYDNGPSLGLFFATNAAIVQGGYGTLGNGGHVGAVHINVDNQTGLGDYLGAV